MPCCKSIFNSQNSVVSSQYAFGIGNILPFVAFYPWFNHQKGCQIVSLIRYTCMQLPCEVILKAWRCPRDNSLEYDLYRLCNTTTTIKNKYTDMPLLRVNTKISVFYTPSLCCLRILSYLRILLISMKNINLRKKNQFKINFQEGLVSIYGPFSGLQAL